MTFKITTFVLFAAFFITQSTWAETKLRIMAANITTGDKQSYDPGEGTRIFQGLKPDVVLIQEFNFKTNTAEEIREFIDTAFGKDFAYYRESEASDQIPNGVISRYPLRASGEWEDPVMPNRDFAWAQIDIPGDRDLWAVSVHLNNKKSGNRVLEAKHLVELLKKYIPEKDYLVLGGDLNTKNSEEEAIEILKEVVTQTSAPLDPKGGKTTNMTGRYPYDWVLTNARLDAHVIPVAFSATTLFPTGLIFDSHIFTPLESVAPIQQDDSWAVGMQHKPVIKDFLVE